MSSFEAKLREALGTVPTPALTTLLSKEFRDAEIVKQPTYRFNRHNLSNDELINLSNKFYNDLLRDFPDKNTSKTVLLLALNLRQTEDIDSCIMKQHKSVTPKDVEITIAGVSREKKASITSQDPQSSKSEEEDLINQIDSALKDVGESEKAQTEVKATNRNLPFGPFLAAYLLKSTIKQVSNVSMGISHMRDRYLGFYPEMECPQFDISTTALTSLQNKLRFDKTMLSTWIFTTADYEHEADVTSVDAGVVRYLANLQFSFSAMPAYNLFRELLLKTGGDPADWIVKMWTDSTRASLAEINKILKHFEAVVENGITKKRSKYFKYARVIDPQYFLKLQPGQSLSLIYLQAKILNHYQNYSAISNPDKIVALSKMGEKQKEFLRHLADVLVEQEGEEEGESTKYSQMARERYRSNKTIEGVTETEQDILQAMAEGKQ